MLIGLDEHPLHQITQSFAGVAGQRLRSGTTATTSACATPTATSASPPTSASTRTTTCSTASSASVTRGASTTSACRAACARTWTTTASGRCASRSSSRCATCASCSTTTTSASRATCCATAPSCRTRTRSRSPASTAGCSASGRRTSWSASATGWVEVAGQRYELTSTTLVVLPQPLVGQPGRPRRPAPRRATTAKRRVPGVRQWVLFRTHDPRRLLLRRPERPGGLRQGCDPAARSLRPGHRRRARARVLRRRPAGAARHATG